MCGTGCCRLRGDTRTPAWHSKHACDSVDRLLKRACTPHVPTAQSVARVSDQTQACSGYLSTQSRNVRFGCARGPFVRSGSCDVCWIVRRHCGGWSGRLAAIWAE